jgi:hypothetical protein
MALAFWLLASDFWILQYRHSTAAELNYMEYLYRPNRSKSGGEADINVAGSVLDKEI